MLIHKNVTYMYIHTYIHTTYRHTHTDIDTLLLKHDTWYLSCNYVTTAIINYFPKLTLITAG